MESIHETIFYKDYKIEILPDYGTESPNDWDDTEMFLIYKHRQFNIERDGFDTEEIYYAYKQNKLEELYPDMFKKN